MRNFFTKLCVVIMLVGAGLTSSLANNGIPASADENAYLIKNSEVTFSVFSVEDENEFINTTFSSENKTIFLETEKEISFIQIMNMDGELEYQLPIASHKLHIDMNDFNSGNYNLNILLEGNDEYITTELEKTF